MVDLIPFTFRLDSIMVIITLNACLMAARYSGVQVFAMLCFIFINLSSVIFLPITQLECLKMINRLEN